MKINKQSLDKLILQVLHEQQTMVSANPLVDSPNPEKSLTTLPKQSLSTIKKPEAEKVDLNKVEIDRNILNSLYTTKEKIRTNLEKMPAKELVSQISTLIDQLSFLDNLKK